MFERFTLIPEQASTMAARVDALWWFLTAVTVFFTIVVCSLALFFAVKYRKGSTAERGGTRNIDSRFEIVWILIPLVFGMIFFFWSASIYVSMWRVPAGALQIYVIGKQWMWKVQHPNGKREINELHVPLGRPVQLTMVSQDVIHSFFIPAFRVKMDVLPGRYTTLWFEATKLGEFHLFCAEYCGTKHAGMIGKVVVMDPARYEEWLQTGAQGRSLAAAGEAVFHQSGCAGCHSAGSAVAAPRLEGLFGTRVKLADGRTVLADDRYLRDSIVLPQSEVVAGYQPVMPSYQGVLDEDRLLQVIGYIKSLRTEPVRQER
jgi:cytochrome c oxidase subunit II